MFYEILQSINQYKSTWSPNSTIVAFTRETAGQIDIWTINADGSNEIEILQNIGPGRIDWSPDGRKIVFSQPFINTNEIWVVEPDGRNETFVSRSTDNQQDPSWSPDSCQLVVTRKDPSSREIAIFKTDVVWNGVIPASFSNVWLAPKAI